MKITIGSVQFGLPYGISNLTGQVSLDEIEKILTLARSRNVDVIDTAIAYGESEAALGMAGVSDFNIITKLPTIPSSLIDYTGWVEKHVEGSLSRLKKNSIHGLLVHDPEFLKSTCGEKLGLALDKMKSSGMVQKIGVSIYQPSVLEDIIKKVPIDIVQAPLNVVDTCIVSSKWLDKLDRAGIKVHARSIFMQGLLLMDRESIPKKFNRWAFLWDHWHQKLKTHDLDALTQCVSFANSISKIDRVIVGIESSLQFKQILNAIDLGCSPSDWSEMSSDDQMLINPSNWGDL